MSARESSRRPGAAARLVTTLLALTLALSGCAAQLRAAADRSYGEQLHPQLVRQFGGQYQDPRVNALIARIGARLSVAPEIGQRRWTYTVLDSPIRNAFALPGDYVYLTRGVIEFVNSEDELAGVMAHEMSHVSARHYREREQASREAMSQAIVAAQATAGAGGDESAQTEAAAVAWMSFLAAFSREQESEADRLSVRALHAAGYDPHAYADFLSGLEAQDAMEARALGDDAAATPAWYSSHPDSATRRREALAEAERLAPERRSRDAETLFAAIDGLLYGDAPSQGFVRGRHFLHPRLRIAFSAPDRFRLLNGPDALTAIGPEGEVVTFFGVSANYPGRMIDYLREVSDEAAQQGDPPLRRIESFGDGSLEAATALAAVAAPLQDYEARIYAVQAGGAIYHFIGFYPRGQGPRMRRQLDRMVGGFRILSAAEASALKPRRLEIVTAGPRDTAARLARRMAVDGDREEAFRLLNGLGANEPVQPGRRLKLVVEG